MSLLELFLIALGVSMDAFAVSICKGLAIGRVTLRQCVKIGLWFGGFQAAMPAAGYFLGESFHSYIDAFDHWIAFILLILIGANMIREVVRKDEKTVDGSLSAGSLFLLAVATSIDALAVGISLSCVEVKIFKPLLIIGLTTFSFSAVGLRLGGKLGLRFRTSAQIVGGLILIAIGIRILAEHLG